MFTVSYNDSDSLSNDWLDNRLTEKWSNNQNEIGSTLSRIANTLAVLSKTTDVECHRATLYDGPLGLLIVIYILVLIKYNI